MEANKINWFPGHMAAASRNIIDSVKNVDLIIEVVDARAIRATSNPFFKQFNKQTLKVALKSDLCDLKSIKNLDNNTIVGSVRDKKFKSKLISKINEILKPLEEKKIKKGLLKPTFYLMVVGLPNVGKSTLINFLSNRNIAQTGNMPAVTKKQAILKINEKFFLQDNPGVFIKNIDNINVGYILASLNTIKREILPLSEIIQFNYDFLLKHYSKETLKYFKINSILSYDEFITHYASARKFIKQNNKIDVDRTLNALFDEITNSKICKINYEI